MLQNTYFEYIIIIFNNHYSVKILTPQKNYNMDKPRSHSPPPRKIHKNNNWKDILENARQSEISRKPAAKKNDFFSEMDYSRREIPNNSSIQDKEWKDSERSFHLDQAKLRSQIRIEQGRETKFDLLLRVLMIYHGEIPFEKHSQAIPTEIREPYLYLNNCNYSELEAIKASIDVHFQLEDNKEKQEFWNSLLNIVNNEIKRAKNTENNQNPSQFKDDIDRIIKNLDEKKLGIIEEQVRQNMNRQDVDKTFWTEVQDNICVYKAKSSIKKAFQNFMEKPETNTNELIFSPSQKRDLLLKDEFLQNGTNDGSESPILFQDETCFDNIKIITPDEEQKAYSNSRRQILLKELEDLIERQKRLISKKNPLLSSDSALYNVLRHEKVVSGNIENSIEDLMKIDMMKNMKLEDGESEFGETIDLKPILEDWNDKYRPRKPKYFNRIKTGYEWTRHNQTHYDHRNPPPKVVQGYKFNIFYPCLIDKTQAPQFYLEPDETNDTAILRFHAGPPYEDIAFRIINREWDFSDRHGFKSFFDKGILHLYFNFKRHRYKR
ncbi:unnamed protein product [Blepharisma stoltei]|uniref:Splicing factor Cactin n=1 Tax=Blepharisma stoltei TaxID=1481888 RepID=A0AAU9IE01_9CILI|nr:unnamed protein product [Blepharisma stoltei]